MHFPPGTLRVVQFTDTHLFADPANALMGVNTEETFLQVLERARSSHWPPDLVLGTGDLVHDSSEPGYQRLRDHLVRLDVPVYLLPGNHDEARALQRCATNSTIHATRAVRNGEWEIVFLDTSLPGSDAGHLSDAELHALQETLAASTARHILVCLHHPPVLVESRWMDTMVIDNAPDLFAIVDRHPAVRGLLWGHIHQEFDALRNGVRLLGTPSTCFQFKPRSAEFALEDIAPGYRWLALQPDGAIVTGVARLETYVSRLDMTSAGY